MKKIILLFILTFQLNAFSAAIVEEGIFIFDHNGEALKAAQAFPELTIDHPSEEGFELYGPRGLITWAKIMHFDFAVMNREQNSASKSVGSDDPYAAYFPTAVYYDEYPTNEDNYQTLKTLEEKYPDIIKLFSIGQSVEGRDIWAIKISDNVEIDEIEPEFKYIANMHGNEITGREMLVRLVKDLAEGYHSRSPRLLRLINNSEIFIIPTMNPDGNALRRRGNSANADLNRDFPDFIKDPVNTIENRQPETAAIMEFQASRQFALSANLHDGISLVNYPWDSTIQTFPLENLVHEFSLEYAANIENMHTKQFPTGVTNGAEWYVIHGGMQDWSYFWHGDLQLTIEVSNRKWPAFYMIDSFYADHKQPLIKLMERIHRGAGFKFNRPEIEGEVLIEKLRFGKKETKNYGTFGFSSSEFYKVLDKGLYRFKVTTQNGQVFTFFRIVSDFPPRANGNYKKLKMTL